MANLTAAAAAARMMMLSRNGKSFAIHLLRGSVSSANINLGVNQSIQIPLPPQYFRGEASIGCNTLLSQARFEASKKDDTDDDDFSDDDFSDDDSSDADFDIDDDAVEDKVPVKTKK
ncbi:hypothetical protein M5689_013626 [Euphorbia peplus]|nr:hypothetical protein M5689_013626 [Euphorbia peplus]